MTDITVLPDGSAFFVGEISDSPPPADPVYWNPFNKVVQDHRTGDIDHNATNAEREKRGLEVPWTSTLGNIEVHQAPVY